MCVLLGLKSHALARSEDDDSVHRNCKPTSAAKTLYQYVTTDCVYIALLYILHKHMTPSLYVVTPVIRALQYNALIVKYCNHRRCYSSFRQKVTRT